MELGLGFADDDLKGDNKDVKVCLTSYNAKICHPKWFLTAEGVDNESRANIKKYQADYNYGNRDYSQAAQCYIEAIGFLSSQNRVMRKAMMESLSRCYCYTGDETHASKLVDELMSDATTTDNVVQVLLLKQLVLNQFGRLPEEIETIQQLIGYHPYNVQFWLMLMRAYKKLLADDSQPLVHADSEALPTDSVNIQNLDEKLENLTIGRSEIGEAQSVSDETKIKQQQSGDGIVGHLVKNCENSSGYKKLSQESSIPSEKLSIDCAHKPHTAEDLDITSVQNDKSRNNDSPTLSQLKLLTCCIAARLLLKSVEGTVASFIKIRNQEILQQVEQIQDDLQLEKSVIQAASEQMIRDFYQSNTTEDDDDDIDSRPQQSNKVSAGDGDNFDEKWFGWIKKL